MKSAKKPVCRQVHTIVVGSGAAGLRAAECLYELGHTDIAVVTEGINCGTSRNTGSDKQTYYKLSLSGSDADSVREMASSLYQGQAVDGDLALCEAAASASGFFHLVQLGVPFPTNEYGEYVGYKTDHDPYRRATSAGPYTSKLMTEALEKSVRKLGITIWDKLQVIELLVSNERIIGVLCLDLANADDPEKRYVAFHCANVIWATGGPAGMYLNSVYPGSQYGATGIAFAAGAEGRNLTEWQFGLASVNPRWNVSGTYMQALPRFVSTDANGEDDREFLLDAFENRSEALSNVFLKGYQWPFDVRKAAEGSSRIDLLVHAEQQKGRRIFLDFRSNPGGEEIAFEKLSPEAFLYLERAGACFGKPIDRLLQMNEPAVDFYMDHGVDLRTQPLEIALCVQHNNGGLAVDHNWKTNIFGLFAIGEAAATHGVYRPGGSALNAGQTGAARAAQAIAAEPGVFAKEELFKAALFSAMENVLQIEEQVLSGKANPDVHLAYTDARKAMDRYAGPVRSEENLRKLLAEIKERMLHFGQVSIKRNLDLRWIYRLKETLICQQLYVQAMLDYLKSGGKSRGSAMYIDPEGRTIERLPDYYRFRLDGNEHGGVVQEIVLTAEGCKIHWRGIRPMPPEDESFEMVWKAYRERRTASQEAKQ
ncbi:MAG: FAD-binding protein [Clostridia bacterium]|nr:FAD-binding protein [Clostridia bacterium]